MSGLKQKMLKEARRRKYRKKNQKTFKEILLTDQLWDTPEANDRRLIMFGSEHPTKLTPEQIIFCNNYIENNYSVVPTIRQTLGEHIIDWNDKKCRRLGNKLLEQPKIKNFITEELSFICEEHRISKYWVCAKYKAWSEIDITDYLTIEYPNIKNARTRPQIKLKAKLEEMPKCVRTAIKGISVTSAGDLKVEFIDQKGALDSLQKLLGMTEEKIKVSGQVNNLHFDKQDSEA